MPRIRKRTVAIFVLGLMLGAYGGANLETRVDVTRWPPTWVSAASSSPTPIIGTPTPTRGATTPRIGSPTPFSASPAPTSAAISSDASTSTPSGGANSSGHVIFTAAGGLAGQRKTDSSVFHATGPFTVNWSTSAADPTAFNGNIIITLQKNLGTGADAVGFGVYVTGQKAPIGSTNESRFDCSGGCYFETQSLNLNYTIQVVQ